MVLVCTNSFTNFRPMLPMHLDLRLQTQTTVRFELTRSDAAKLSGMPAIVCKVRWVRIPSLRRTTSPPHQRSCSKTFRLPFSLCMFILSKV